MNISDLSPEILTVIGRPMYIKQWVLDDPDYEADGPLYLGHYEYEGDDTRSAYYMPELMSGSDYSGSSITVANHRVFLEEYGHIDGVHDVYGSHGTYGVVLREDALLHPDNDSLRETLQELYSYPVINDDAVNEVEHEAETEAWESWAEHDFRESLQQCVREYDASVDVEFVNDIGSDNLREIFIDTCDRINEYWVHETGNDAYIDVDAVAISVDIAEFINLWGKKESY